MIGAAFGLWFVVALRGWLLRRERGDAGLANLMLAAMVAATAMFWIADGVFIGLATRAREGGEILSATTAATLYDAANVTVFTAVAVAVGTALAAIAVLGFRDGARCRIGSGG